MDGVSELFEMISVRLRQSRHLELLKMLIDSFMEEGSGAVEAKIKEILHEIEGE